MLIVFLSPPEEHPKRGILILESYNLPSLSLLIFANLILSILEFPTHDNLGIITNLK